jgi:CheY-like chemotaxis protein
LVVLVVEDELFVRLIAAETIREAGHVVVEAGDAGEALAVLEGKDGIDVIFSDIKMPGPLDGIGLAALVRERWPTMPIILTSGHLCRSDLAADVTTFLQKPYPASILLAELDRLSR